MMKSQWQQQIYRKAITILLTISGIFTSTNLKILAQITPDNTLGSENSIVNQVNEVKDLIEGGATRGTNLFHSFEKFNVGENRSVYFANPVGIENILTRVTGGNVSNILGTLGVNGTANLFLINPNGIYFGKDAVLDIRGSFTATTADEIKLGENGLFSATNPESSNLLTVQPSALFINAVKNQQAKIENQGNLITGKDLIFFASRIKSNGILSTSNGKIELTSTVGDIQVNELTAQAATITANQNINYGNISIVADDNTADYSLNPTLLLTAGKQITGTGNITTTGSELLVNLQAKDNINIKNISSKGSDINITSESGDIITGILYTTPDVTSKTTTIDIDQGRTFTMNSDEGIYEGEFTFNSNLTDPITEVKVRLSASNIISKSWVFLSSPTRVVSLIASTGDNLANFQDTLLTDSASTHISSVSTPFNGTFQPNQPLADLNRHNPNGTWYLRIFNFKNNTTTTVYKAGDTAPWGIATGTQLIITTSRNLGSGGNVNLKAGGKISTGDINSSSNINAGLINLNANHDITTNNINSSSISGNGGAISLTTTQGNISTQSLDSRSDSIDFGTRGNGGAITLTAGGDISTQSLYSSAESYSGTGGNGGGITLNAGGDISTQYLDSRAESYSGTAGNGGAITLAAGGNISTQYLDSYSYSISGTGGNGGGITLNAGGNISNQSLDSYSFSNSGTAGNGGVISLNAGGDISTQRLASLSASAGSGTAGNGGAISLNAGGDITTQSLLHSGSVVIFGSGTAGNGGAISFHAGGDITAQSFLASSTLAGSTTGNGGAISLNAGGDIITQDLFSTSFSGSGTAGNGGAISLNAGGDIGKIETSSVFSSFSASEKGISGDGGNITLAAKNKITNLDILTLSSHSQSGVVQVHGFGDLLVTNTNIITSKQLTVKDPAFEVEFTLDVSGVGQSGNVNITSTGNLTFNNSRIESDTKGDNSAGKVTITSPGTVTFNNNSKIFSSTSSTGKAGNISINANNLNLTDTSEISASTTAEGKAGDITLNTSSLIVSKGAKIFATTTGNGDGGTITINAPNTVNLGIGVQDSSPILSVETSGAGKAGNININTPSLTVSDTARITATATAIATNQQGGGSITLNASKMNLAGVVGVFAETKGEAPAGILQLNPYENQPDLDITLFPNSTISASTSASGKGGDLIITAPKNINISGQGKLAVESTGSGDAGNISITTQNFNITDGVKISASTSTTGRGGNINVNANTFIADNSAQLLTTTSGNNQAGNINLQVKDNITLNDTNTGLFANTEIGATGKSGNITIDPEIFIIKNGAGIGVNSQGSGEGGNISIAAGTLSLDNQGFISAETASNQGGNINLNIQDLLSLRNRSNITATAGTNGAGGDGGNININAPFIIAFPSENSNITANAFQGNGGKINITTNAIFGLEYRLQLTPESDITASSDFGLAGEVEINTPDVDPTSGLIELPGNLVDASNQLYQGCRRSSKENTFTIVGRVGLPSTPNDLLTGVKPLVDLVDVVDSQEITKQKTTTSIVNNEFINLKNPIIQEAQGWIITNDGRVILTATSPQVIPQSSGLNHPSCK